jgi:hypothetical protein
MISNVSYSPLAQVPEGKFLFTDLGYGTFLALTVNYGKQPLLVSLTNNGTQWQLLPRPDAPALVLKGVEIELIATGKNIDFTPLARPGEIALLNASVAKLVILPPNGMPLAAIDLSIFSVDAVIGPHHTTVNSWRLVQMVNDELNVIAKFP